MWVTYRGGVYNVTEFHKVHPGGSLILQALGGDVAPFWDVWAYHHGAPKVGEYLEALRIGAVEGWSEGDDSESTMGEDPESDPYLPSGASRAQTVARAAHCSETPNAVRVELPHPGRGPLRAKPRSGARLRLGLAGRERNSVSDEVQRPAAATPRGRIRGAWGER